MKLSHSKLNCILNCPMSYYLKYEEGIQLKEKKPALYIGSAVHWGIEHNTEDLTEYFNSSEDRFTKEQLLSEAMVHGYLKHKNELFDMILTDPGDGQKINILDEYHEVPITGKLPSQIQNEPHDFIGIIDLLLLTEKGFIIIDYKTSSQEPNWEAYQDQLYRYIFLLKSQFPDTPILKIGIINLRKTQIRQKKNENYEEFLNRMKFEYDINDENYVNYHEFPVSALDDNLVDEYLKNLTVMSDLAQTIVDKKLFFINFFKTTNDYGKSDYWDIFYHTPDAYLLYNISDHIWNEETGEYEESRDCVPLDLDFTSKKINKYKDFKDLFDKCFRENKDFTTELESYKYDEELLKKYIITYSHENN